MEYDVTLVLTLYSKNRTHFSPGYKKIKLPFPPYIGLSIMHGPVDFGEICSVTWIESEKRFSCSLERESKGSNDNLDFLIKMAKEAGYEEFDQVYEF